MMDRLSAVTGVRVNLERQQTEDRVYLLGRNWIPGTPSEGGKSKNKRRGTPPPHPHSPRAIKRKDEG